MLESRLARRWTIGSVILGIIIIVGTQSDAAGSLWQYDEPCSADAAYGRAVVVPAVVVTKKKHRHSTEPGPNFDLDPKLHNSFWGQVIVHTLGFMCLSEDKELLTRHMELLLAHAGLVCRT